MNRQETGIIMDILATAYPRFYAGQNAPDPERAVALWAEMFAGDDVALVAAAVKSWIEADEKGFPPSIGQIKGKLRQITGEDQELTEAEAWALVSSAVRNGIYGAQEEFQKLPLPLQRIVGSPATLREWACMDSQELHTVVASNVQRSYRQIAAQEREMAKLPADVRAVVLQIAERAQEPVKVELPPSRYISQEETVERMISQRRVYWERAAEEQARIQRRREEVIAELRGGHGD